MTGRHVELRLIGYPDRVDAVLELFRAAGIDLTTGARRSRYDRAGRVIQDAVVTAPERGE